jgi:hypothetical protein
MANPTCQAFPGMGRARGSSAFIGVHPRLKSFFSPRAVRKTELPMTPMNANGFAQFVSFRPRIYRRVIDNLLISIE